MPVDFPGMDPYLEQPRIWSQFHNQLIVHIQNYLTPLLRPNYIVDTDLTTYLVTSEPDDQDEVERLGRPDHLILSTKSDSPAPTSTLTPPQTATQPVITHLSIPEGIKHLYLEIRAREYNQVVTVIEILSPANKQGLDRDKYEIKRRKVLSSATNLVEIDLLCGGQPMQLSLNQTNDYRILVRRWWENDAGWVHLFSLRDAIPDIPIPLSPDETEPILPLNDILHRVYEVGGFDLKIDYSETLYPALPEADEAWIKENIFDAKDDH